MMALFHDLRKDCNKQIFHRQWNALLDAYPDARDHLESTWGKEKCKYWATCYHWECFTDGIQSFQRGENINRWVKALCTKVRTRCSVNKIFDAVERLVKCQMRTQNRCLAIDDLKKTITTFHKALTTVIPLVQASLTNYSLQHFLVQVDMGTTMYDVQSSLLVYIYTQTVSCSTDLAHANCTLFFTSRAAFVCKKKTRSFRVFAPEN